MNFSSKKVGETLTIGFNLVRNLSAGETITGAVFSISVDKGSDSSPSSMISGSASIAGSIVKQKVIGGVAGCYYLVKVTVTTSAGNVFIEEATLQVTA